MPTLKETATQFVGKKELYDLPNIPMDIEIKNGTYPGKGALAGKDVPFQYIEVNGWKYTIRANVMSQIQQIALTRPTCKNIKVNKAPNGELYVVPLD